MVPVDASCARLSAAEDGRVLLAIWGTFLDVGTHHYQNEVINVVDIGQCLHRRQRAAGMEEGGLGEM